MAMCSLDNVCKQFGAQIVLENLCLEINPSETVGLVGTNGAGKTTLFRLLTGELAPDTGSVHVAKGVSIGFLPQSPDIDPHVSLRDAVGAAFEELLDLERRCHDLSDAIAQCDDDAERQRLMQRYDRLHELFIAKGGHTFEVRMHEILGGLGFSPDEYDRPLSVLSGGQQCRVSLAKLLLQDRRLLLLDEPTNHLDIDAVQWLEKFLAGHRGGTVVVSHDRYLLDRLCERIVELDNRRVTSYPGNYSNYVIAKETRLLTEQRRFDRDGDFIRKERAFINKHLAGQRTKEAQGRRKRLERRLAGGEFVTATSRKERTARIKFDQGAAQVGTVMRGEELSMSFGELQLFHKESFTVQGGQTLGITGPNGCGKTTLLRILMGETAPVGGTVHIEPNLRIGYYAQQSDTLDPASTVVEELRSAKADLTEREARSYAALFRFYGDDVFKKLGTLSGGERSRVRLASLILPQPDLLVLDEPTNHLDIPSREALEESLGEFGGTMVIVSHDRYFLDRIADRLLVMRPAGWKMYDGNYSYYLKRLRAERDEAKSAARGAKRAASKASSTRIAGSRDTKKPVRSRYDSLTVDEIEGLVMEHESKLAVLQERFGDAEVYKNPELLADLREEAECLGRELAEVDAAWQQRVETQ